MKLSRNINAPQLIKALQKFGYESTRQSGSHIRLTTQQKRTTPYHPPQPRSFKNRNPKCHTYRSGTAFRYF